MMIRHSSSNLLYSKLYSQHSDLKYLFPDKIIFYKTRLNQILDTNLTFIKVCLESNFYNTYLNMMCNDDFVVACLILESLNPIIQLNIK